MEANPLKDITEKLKQQGIDQRLQSIEADLKILKGANTMKLIELDVILESGPYSITKSVSLNPACITYIENEDDEHCYIHTSDKSVLHVLKSRTDILKLLDEQPRQTYIT